MKNYFENLPALKLNGGGIIGSIIAPILFLLLLSQHPGYLSSGGDTPGVITLFFAMSYLISLIVCSIFIFFGFSAYTFMAGQSFIIIIGLITMGIGYFVGTLVYTIGVKIASKRS
jgi:hypothetical protein